MSKTLTMLWMLSHSILVSIKWWTGQLVIHVDLSECCPNGWILSPYNRRTNTIQPTANI